MTKRPAQRRTAAPAALAAPPVPREPIEFEVSGDGSATKVVFTGATGKTTTLMLDIDALAIAAVGFTTALRAALGNFRDSAHKAARERNQRPLRG